MSVLRTYSPGLDDTQKLERSPAANPPSRGRARAIARRDAIRNGTSDREQHGGDFPPREEPNLA